MQKLIRSVLIIGLLAQEGMICLAGGGCSKATVAPEPAKAPEATVDLDLIVRVSQIMNAMQPKKIRMFNVENALQNEGRTLKYEQRQLVKMLVLAKLVTYREKQFETLSEEGKNYVQQAGDGGSVKTRRFKSHAHTVNFKGAAEKAARSLVAVESEITLLAQNALPAPALNPCATTQKYVDDEEEEEEEEESKRKSSASLSQASRHDAPHLVQTSRQITPPKGEWDFPQQQPTNPLPSFKSKETELNG